MFFFYFSLSCVLFDETQTHTKNKSPNYRRATVSLSSTTVGRWNSCGRWVIQNNQTSNPNARHFVVFKHFVSHFSSSATSKHKAAICMNFFRNFSVAFVSVSVSVSVFRDRRNARP